jgi:hypothetical protein
LSGGTGEQERGKRKSGGPDLGEKQPVTHGYQSVQPDTNYKKSR